MGKHLLDETAEFTIPRLGRHASPEVGELEATQRMEPVDLPRAAHWPRPDEGAQAR